MPLTREDAGNQIISLPWRAEALVRSWGAQQQMASPWPTPRTGSPLPGLLREVLVGEVVGPGGHRGEASSGLGVGLGKSCDPGC